MCEVRYVFEYTHVTGDSDDRYYNNIVTGISKKVIRFIDGENLVCTFTDGTLRAASRCYNTYEEALDEAVKHNTIVINKLQESLDKAIKEGLKHDVKRT